jgi:hypothetical protein
VKYNTKCKNYKGEHKKGVSEKDIAKAIKEHKDPNKLTAAIHALVNKVDESSSNSDSNESNNESNSTNDN